MSDWMTSPTLKLSDQFCSVATNEDGTFPAGLKVRVEHNAFTERYRLCDKCVGNESVLLYELKKLQSKAQKRTLKRV